MPRAGGKEEEGQQGQRANFKQLQQRAAHYIQLSFPNSALNCCHFPLRLELLSNIKKTMDLPLRLRMKQAETLTAEGKLPEATDLYASVVEAM